MNSWLGGIVDFIEQLTMWQEMDSRVYNEQSIMWQEMDSRDYWTVDYVTGDG